MPNETITLPTDPEELEDFMGFSELMMRGAREKGFYMDLPELLTEWRGAKARFEAREREADFHKKASQLWNQVSAELDAEGRGNGSF